MDEGDIYLAFFPFGDLPGRKLRPVLLLTPPLGFIPELLVAYISSVMPSPLLPSDLFIDPGKPAFSSTNLKKPSILRLHKQSTLHQSSIVRFLGRLSPTLLNDVKDRLRVLLNL